MKTYCPNCQSETYTHSNGTENCTRCSWWYNRGSPAKIKKIDESMYNVTLEQRNAAWVECANLKAENSALRDCILELLYFDNSKPEFDNARKLLGLKPKHEEDY